MATGREHGSATAVTQVAVGSGSDQRGGSTGSWIWGRSPVASAGFADKPNFMGVERMRIKLVLS